MHTRKATRRQVLQGFAATSLAVPAFSRRALAAAPAASKVTPELIEAAKKEGKVVWYTAVDLPVAERIAKAFEAKYPGIAMRVERSGGERIYQRIGQEYASNIHAVDVVNSSDAAHFIAWKRAGILAPYVPDDVALHYAPEHRDADGLYASWRVWLSVIGYNVKLVSPADAPKSFADLLDPKWTGKIVKAHPGYSGTIMTATFQIAREIGWDYFEKLSRQKVMQVQSSADPPKKLALGERAIMADGNEYNLIQLKERGEPLQCNYRALAKASRRLGRPVRIHAIHLTDDTLGGEAMNQRQVIGHSFLMHLCDPRKISRIAGRQASPQRFLTGLQQMEELAAAPVLGRFALVGASVLHHLGSLRHIGAPAESPTFVDRVKGIENDHGAS